MFQKFTPIEYLKIDIANNFGLDKTTWDTRIAWADENDADLEAMMNQADEPALYFAGVQALRKAQNGEPVAYPVGLDATASGAQLLAALVGCELSAKLCNVIDTGDREDFYTRVYEAMLDRLGNQATLTRSQVKDAIVPWFYGSKALPKKIFGEGLLLETFLSTIAEEAPGVAMLNEALMGLWRPDVLSHDWVMPDNFHVKVKVMDDHSEVVHFLDRPYEVQTKVNRPMDEGLSIPANVTHSIDGMLVREVLRRCNYDRNRYEEVLELLLTTSTHCMVAPRMTPNATMLKTLMQHYHESGFLSARVIDYIDTNTVYLLDSAERKVVGDLLLTFAEKSFPVISVHDRFGCHPNYGNELRRVYNQLLHEIAASTLLQNLASQIAGTSVNVNKLGDISAPILEANYALS